MFQLHSAVLVSGDIHNDRLQAHLCMREKGMKEIPLSPGSMSENKETRAGR